MVRWIIPIAAIGLLGFALGSREVRPMAKEALALYVSTTGNDQWTGRLAAPNAAATDGPFATLGKARDAVRLLKERGSLGEPITVFLRAGRYPLAEPLVFTSRDSGTREHPITYSAYENEMPVISGGRQLTGWKRDQGELWSVEIAEVRDGTWTPRQLFVNGHRRRRARMPNTGFFQVDGEITLEEPARFQFRGDDIRPEWAERGDVEVVALQAWAEFRMPIREVDPASRTVTLTGKCARSNREKNARYWVENLREALDAPGEWYLDRRAGRLLYWPMPGEDLATAEVMAPVLGTLVRFEGDPARGEPVRHIELRGLTLAHTDWSLPPSGYTDVQAAYDIPAAVEASGAVSCAIEQCRLVHLGQYAISFGRGCQENRIVGCQMTDLGAGGIKIGEPLQREADADRTYGTVITDNHIHDIGIVYPAAVGVWIGQSSGNRVAHNHIHDTFYSALSIGWTWGYGPTLARDNTVEFNHVHDIGRGMLSDMGGIYTLGVQPGTVIRNNLFHDITSHGYGGWGIYPDEGSSQILIENNIVYRTKSGGFHQHYGRENIVRNNIFAFAREGQIIRTRAEPHLSFTFERNIVYWSEAPLLGSNWDGNQYHLDHNLYFRTDGQPVRFKDWSFDEWQQRGQDRHSQIADPLFEDPARGDFRLKPKSPAIRLGFHPIDVSKVGPRDR